MGIWGPGLYSNDDAFDLKAMFKELIAYGKSTNKAVAEIRKEFDMVVTLMPSASAIWAIIRATYMPAATFATIQYSAQPGGHEGDIPVT